MAVVPGASLAESTGGARRPVLGRDELVASLASLPEREAPLVTHVHGIAGIDKSSLLSAVAAPLERGKRLLDREGVAIEPTEPGFLDALGRVVGHDLPTVEAVRTLAQPGARAALA